jgi:hypothetical protein
MRTVLFGDGERLERKGLKKSEHDERDSVLCLEIEKGVKGKD